MVLTVLYYHCKSFAINMMKIMSFIFARCRQLTALISCTSRRRALAHQRCGLTSGSAIAERPLDTSFLSVVIFNSSLQNVE